MAVWTSRTVNPIKLLRYITSIANLPKLSLPLDCYLLKLTMKKTNHPYFGFLKGCKYFLIKLPGQLHSCIVRQKHNSILKISAST
ncbi:hypothetical protein L484_019761 [Morus notabilis]|uniref:Uncharacterized protein n=1 Tax=Morus notabilis TaxID=981085 RepID=W9QZC2_9ROSA|nr:hypothetical protein L484_019761 [Morus notabilis]